ncbi:MAG: hypothetical protein NVSMB63_09150 [Sediminibacterium sp.]
MKYLLRYLCVGCLAIVCATAHSQVKPDGVLPEASLKACVQYALLHQPVLQQSLLDESIVERQIRTRLADWYPQANLNYSLQHVFELPTSYFSGGYLKNGTYNTSSIGLNVTQNIFNRDVLLASRTASDVRQQVRQNTTGNKIDVAVNVSKAFYDVLLTQKQVEVLTAAITRLERSLKDAYSQYQSGIADKTDYKRATIALNNAKSQQKQSLGLVTAKYTYLKQLMGFPDSLSLHLAYDTTRLEKDAFTDTLQTVQYDNRIEYQQLQTQQRLQQANLKYYQWGYLPALSAFGNYNLGYLNNDFAKTYDRGFPNSNIGLQLTMPVFLGNKRQQQVRQAALQVKRVDLDMALLKSKVNTQYAQAMALYKGSFYNYLALKENVQMADDVYKTIRLQYTSGIKTYLDVIIAESDLRTTELNYYNALYQLLQSKLDVERSLGTVQY